MNIACCYLYIITKYGYPPKHDDEFAGIREIANLGFTALELKGIQTEHLNQVYTNRYNYKQFCDDLGLKIIVFCPVIPAIMSLNKTNRIGSLSLFELGLEIAVCFGTKAIQIDSFAPPFEFIGNAPYKDLIKSGKQIKVKIDPQFRWTEQWDVLVDSVVRCNEKAKKSGLKLLMEPRVGELINNTEAVLRLMDAVHDDNFQVILDTGHLHAQKEIIPLSIEKLGPHIGYVHAADNDGKTNAHLGLGKGTIDWEGMLVSLSKHKFNGYIGIDIGEISNIDVEYRDSKKFLEQIIRKLVS